jgi:hypothetical protein
VCYLLRHRAGRKKHRRGFSERSRDPLLEQPDRAITVTVAYDIQVDGCVAQHGELVAHVRRPNARELPFARAHQPKPECQFLCAVRHAILLTL